MLYKNSHYQRDIEAYYINNITECLHVGNRVCGLHIPDVFRLFYYIASYLWEPFIIKKISNNLR